MRHIDPDAVALAALGEPLDAADRAHLAECAVCAREVASLAATVAVGRRTTGEQLVAPPDAVWERVRDELGLPAHLAPGGPADPADATGMADAPGLADGEPDAPRHDGTPGEGPGTARGGRSGWLLAAAAGLVVGGVAGGLVVASALRSDEESVLAEAQLDALPGWSASGDAVVEEDAEGRRTLVVRLAGAEADGFREVWLLDREATRLVGLGVLDGDEGRFTIPVGLDLDDFAVVDVSAEPFDGDPAHSGDSILRGELGTPA
ncbi:anti-sigma factor [Cellulomonas sp. Marseille-Q8402]